MKILFFVGFLLLSVFSCKNSNNTDSDVIPLTNWRFCAGDSSGWANPNFDIANWDTVGTTYKWGDYGYKDLNGYAWYRINVIIPTSLKRSIKYDSVLVFDIGKIDNADQVFLNGYLIGYNGNNVSFEDSDKIEFKKGRYWDIARKYSIPTSDKRIVWDKENVIAVKTWTKRGPGGIYDAKPVVRMQNLSDFIDLDLGSTTYKISNNTNFEKKFFISNTSTTDSLFCSLNISIVDQISGENIENIEKSISLKESDKQELSFEFRTEAGQNCIAKFLIKDNNTENSFIETDNIPFILTPKVSKEPKVNGPSVYGAIPGHEFLYKIPVSGAKPFKYSVVSLPKGLSLDITSGIITGLTPSKGSYKVKLIAENEFGVSHKEFTIISGERLSLTPPMGWNSWNCWGLSVSDNKIRISADAMISSGLADYGYTYINIDDGWEAKERLDNGILMGNSKFPDFPALSHYVHSLGLKLGIYSSPGPLTCGSHLGSYTYEFIDAKKWGEWGIDYLKYDWCFYEKIAPNHSLPELKKPYTLMRNALDKVNRDIVYSLCQYGWGDVWEWGYNDGGNLWRTTFDIVDSWESLKEIGFSQNVISSYAKPGGWNDPDMLIVGWVGWGPNLHPTRLTPDEQYTHLSLWVLLSAPLLLGNDMARLDDFTLNLLTNNEVLDVNQDVLGKQAKKVYDKDKIQYWLKELSDGSFALGIFNLNNELRRNVSFEKLDIFDNMLVRDLWRQKDIGVSNNLDMIIPSHGVKLFKLTPKTH